MPRDGNFDAGREPDPRNASAAAIDTLAEHVARIDDAETRALAVRFTIAACTGMLAQIEGDARAIADLEFICGAARHGLHLSGPANDDGAPEGPGAA